MCDEKILALSGVEPRAPHAPGDISIHRATGTSLVCVKYDNFRNAIELYSSVEILNKSRGHLKFTLFSCSQGTSATVNRL